MSPVTVDLDGSHFEHGNFLGERHVPKETYTPDHIASKTVGDAACSQVDIYMIG